MNFISLGSEQLTE